MLEIILAVATILGGLSALGYFADAFGLRRRLFAKSSTAAPPPAPATDEHQRVGPFHPPGTEQDRGPLTPCQFYINPQYDRTGAWRDNADVLVELPHPFADGRVYLIPSGAVPPSLRHTGAFRRNARLVDQKRRASARFVERWKDRPLDGYWFVLKAKDGDRVKVYSPVYDNFLRASLVGQ
jgi:hypothetical protein